MPYNPSKKDQLRTGRVVELVSMADVCLCDKHGYCPVHGEYNPAVVCIDGEIVSTVRIVPSDHRVVHKKEND